MERHRAAWELPFLSLPAWCDVPAATWTAADHAAAETAFRDWQARNLDLLQRREANKLTFYDPDPA